MAERKENRNIVYEIRAHLGVISGRKDGWKKELNLVSWNGQEPPKFDIRDWSEDHTKMGRGITLYDHEMKKVAQFFNEFCNARIVAEGKHSRSAAALAGLKAGGADEDDEYGSADYRKEAAYGASYDAVSGAPAESAADNAELTESVADDAAPAESAADNAAMADAALADAAAGSVDIGQEAQPF